MPHLHRWFDYLGKGEMLTSRDETNLCTKLERSKLFVSIEHFWDLLFKLMKHGTDTLHVAFLFLYSMDYIFENKFLVYKFCATHVHTVLQPAQCDGIKIKSTKKYKQIDRMDQ
jgi:hypothetical protein